MQLDTSFQGRDKRWTQRPAVPTDANWKDVWITATPIRAALILSRVFFAAFERLSPLKIEPTVTMIAIQGILPWPAAALGSMRERLPR